MRASSIVRLGSSAARFSTPYSFRRSLATHAQANPAAGTFNLVEKIVQKYAVDSAPGSHVKSGDYVSIRPGTVMTHDNTGPVISKFASIGASKIFNPDQVVFALDHDVQNKSAKNLEKYSKIESFARKHGIDFYPAGRGIGHQVLVEEGYAFPQTLAVASDSHSNMYGGVGCLGTPIVRTDAAAIWATGQTWWQIPEVVKVELKGNLPKGVTGKDVIVALCGYFNQDQVLNAAIEFVGTGLHGLTVEERLAIANMTTEWGALAGLFPTDDVTLAWYEKQIRKRDKLEFQIGSSPSPSGSHPRLNMHRLEQLSNTLLRPDSDAKYSKHLTLDLSTLVPHVSGPNSVKVSTPLDELASQQIAINKAYLVSCVNSRASDLKAAADVIRGKKVAKGVEFYVAAASSVVQREAEESGDWGVLMAAGAKPLPAGCGPCIGLGVGLLEDGEVGISATNRNYKGRMGSPNAQAYLASPAVVAASAVEGKICGPSNLDPSLLPPSDGLKYSITTSGTTLAAESNKGGVDIMADFPKSFKGPLIFAPQDNLNTDGIYPGKYTYQDDITPTKQAEVVMENYDPSFSSTVASLRSPTSEGQGSEAKLGPVLIGGYNFGTGSSREQAATALKYAGIPLVLAGSFGDIFKRNAINNGLICLECHDLVQDLTQLYLGQGAVRNHKAILLQESTIHIDSSTGSINLTFKAPNGEMVIKKYTAKPAGIGRSVQEIYTAGGLERWVKERI
ncbi:probable LYS4 - homoaconitase precursor [Melanopsichium pennsylvanicum]|uniref:Homoaconitase, mitochondrial n=2 Tax=Melanopsichium pennsylvanicum TaxID=63383 RepID=A0AAJ4XTE7_9BASI|nr:probable LYS4-homoaconitase precursor [Melanopsichium pennsylvanicum 4]SNX87621.1 probable LYS4 - homoaconitase precursor [Melanopsichium pennsylvanicum]